MTATTHPEWNEKTEALEVAAAFPDAIKGKTILITGVNKLGIGFATAEAFASQFPKTLILAARSAPKIQECVDALKSKFPSIQYRPLILDLSSQSAVREAAKELLSWTDISTIDLLINNAGVMNIPERTLSPDGLEMQFATNHIGHYLFTNLIISKITAAAKSAPKGLVRIINVASRGVAYSPIRFSDINLEKTLSELSETETPGDETSNMMSKMYESDITQPYIPMIAYGQSKTANVLFSLGLSERLYEKHGILSLGLHPGGIITELGRHSDSDKMSLLFEQMRKQGFYFKTIGEGASTTLTAALDPKLGLPVRNGKGKEVNHRTIAQTAGENWEGKGGYLADCQINGEVPLWVTSWSDAEKLWKLSEEIVGEKFEY